MSLLLCGFASLPVTWAQESAAPAPQAPIVSSQSLDEYYGVNVAQVDVQGVKRIEKEAVLGKLSTRVGSPLADDSVRADIQAIFNMGYFDDISVQVERAGSGVNVTYVVRERPVISKISFEGNERISTTDLAEVVKVKEWSILDINKVKEDVGLIQKHYEEKGFYLAKVTFDVKSVKPDEVELTYKVADYDKVQIKKITFLNNKRFSDEELKSVFRETREGGLFSFISNSGNFKESAFKQDLQMLSLWYLDHGYVKFRYENPVVTVSDDKRFLFITVYVDEGEQYKMAKYDFSGDLLFPKEELHQELQLLPGETFSISKRNADIQRLTEKYQDLGYAFVNVVPKMNFNDADLTIDMDYGFEKGNLVYFGEINVLGNTKTHDKVIRRELRIHEGELYSGTKLRISRENVERLGYFAPGEVLFNTVSPKGKLDVLNVDITVKERSTGTITLGAGYGSVQKFFFTTQISEINLMGRGQTLSLQAQLASSAGAKSFNLGFTDPFTMDTKWTAGFDVFYVNFPIPNKYQTRKLGFDVRLGYPIFEYTNAYVTYKNEGLRLEPLTEGSRVTVDFNDPETQADIGVLSSVVFSVVHDKRNNRFETTAGNYQSASLETAGIFGDKRFFKAVVNSRFYKRVIGDLVFRNNLEAGHLFGWSGRRTPPAERFYLGGPNNLRGYELFSVGPKRIAVDTQGTAFQQPLGGLIELLGMFELEYPLIREAGLKAVAFVDTGSAFNPSSSGGGFKLKSDYGFGFRWFSPIGPLRFEWGFPINPAAGEDSVFQFFIGPPF